LEYSKFNLEIANPSDSSEVILFNTLNGSLISLPLKELNQLKEKLSKQDIDSENNDDIRMLNELGFLESDNKDSKKNLANWFREVQNDAESLNLTIVTTLACNFNCPYCVQGTYHPTSNMNEVTIKGIFDFIINEFTYKPFRKLFVTYYGGEPLLNINVIRFFQKQLESFCVKNNVTFQSHLITNGSLLNHFKNDLKELKINSLKVTLDGTPEYHNKTRSYKNGNPSFDDIISALEQIPKGIDIHIGSNFQDNNFDGINELPELLFNSKLYSKIKQFNSKPVLEPYKITLPNTSQLACQVFSDKTLGRWKTIQDKCDKLCFKTINYTNKFLCSYYLKRDVTISPNGEIYPCPSFMDSTDNCLGTIYDKQSLLERCPDIPIDNYCINCTYLPLCGGGCRYASQICFGDIQYLNCEKEFLKEAIYRSIIKESRYLQ